MARRLACSNFLRWTSTPESRLSRNRLASSARASAGSANASLKMSGAVRFMGSILTATTSRQERSGTRDREVARTPSDRTADAARGPRQKAVVVAWTALSASVTATRQGKGRTSSHSNQVTERVQLADVHRPQSARRSVPRDCRLSSAPAVDPGREQPPCFAQAPVPDPVRGLLTPRLSVLLSAPRSRARNHSRRP